MIQYGLISRTDAATLEKTIDLIAKDFSSETINILEIGLFDGGTTKGIQEYCSLKKIPYHYTGIDNEKDKSVKELEFYYCNLIIGNSTEVYNQLEDNSQHLIFHDACHCFAHTVSDFFCYADKVKVGGYFAFHDCGKHIAKFKDFQHGDKNNPDAYISVRKALEKIGLLNEYVHDTYDSEETFLSHWGLIFDEADQTDAAGGICCFKKLY